METRLEKFYKWLAWKLPRRLVMWCAVRLMAHATQGPYSHQIVPELLVVDALKRWDEKPCFYCHGVDVGQARDGDYSCPVCGLPLIYKNTVISSPAEGEQK